MNRCKLVLAGILAALFLFTAASGLALSKVFFHGDREKPKIAITMDDCWIMGYVEQMLDLCKEYGIHMTFFPCGTSIREENAGIWKRVIEEGHELGNHTQNHRKLTKLDATHIREELRIMKNRLNNMLGYEYDLRLMRPPYGAFGGGNGSKTARTIEKQGYPYIIMWSLSQTNPDEMLKKVKNGDILLYHAKRKDVECLKKAIPILLDRGFELVTVSGLMELDTAGAQEVTPELKKPAKSNSKEMRKEPCKTTGNML